MFSLAWASVRHHRGGFAGVFVAVFLCAALITAMGVLIESGLRGGTAPERLRGSDVVLGAPQAHPVPEDMDAPFAERVLLPAGTAAEVAAVPGVERAIGVVEIPLAGPGGSSLTASAWDSAELGGYALVSGTPPRTAAEVVVDESFGTEPGGVLSLAYGGVFEDYTVTGVADGPEPGASAVFLSSTGADALWPHGNTVSLVGVVAEPGVSAESLKAGLEARVDGVVAYTGDRRGDVESIAGAGSRSMLLLLSTSLAGVAVMTAVFITAGTLSLSILGRRREFAMLRAVGAGPGQTLGLVVREVALVACVAALLGAVPGFWLAGFLAGQFQAGGVIPDSFLLAYSPLPALAAVLLSLAAAAGAALISARGTVRLGPTTALRESVTEAPRLGRGRARTGLSLLGAGMLAALVPLSVPGTAGLASAAGSVLLLAVGTAVLGPWLASGAVRLMQPLARRSRSASLVLAEANLSAFPRRLASGIVPLVLAVSLGLVQFLMPATVETEAGQQARDAVLADYVVSAPGSGVSTELAAQVAALPGAGAVTPVAGSAVLAGSRFLGMDDGVEPYAVLGVAPQNVDATLDLDVHEGSLDRLADPGTVALSEDLARASGTGLGGQFAFYYGDGTEARADVVAVYGRNLGMGDVVVANGTLLEHTTSALNDYLLVTAAPSADADDLAEALSALGLTVQDRDGLGAAGAAERKAQSWPSIIAMLVLLGYLGVSVVNSLVMATARRRPEMMLLRALGASDRQLRRMTGAESLLLAGTAVVVGTALALPPLIGIAVNVSGQPVPTMVPSVYAAVAGITALLGLGSVAVATRTMLRPARR